MKKIVIVSVLFIVSSISSVTFAAPGWVTQQKVCSVQSTNGVGYIQICGGYAARVCGRPTYVQFPLNAPNGPEMYSTALLSFSLDKRIMFYVTSNGDCANTYDYITGLRIYN